MIIEYKEIKNQKNNPRGFKKMRGRILGEAKIGANPLKSPIEF